MFGCFSVEKDGGRREAQWKVHKLKGRGNEGVIDVPEELQKCSTDRGEEVGAGGDLTAAIVDCGGC